MFFDINSRRAKLIQTKGAYRSSLATDAWYRRADSTFCMNYNSEDSLYGSVVVNPLPIDQFLNYS